MNFLYITTHYEDHFNDMIIREDSRPQIIECAKRIKNGMPIYNEVSNQINPKIPWYFIGIIHMMEASCRFSCHLHNGDPLLHRTVHVPEGRPIHEPKTKGGYTWLESACDALCMKGFNSEDNWTIELMLERFEKYNGFGYAKRGLLSPYIWCGTEYYHSGKYVSDGHFDPDAVSKQIGAAPLLRYVTDKTLGIV
jgi:lysozyme family protein